MKSILKRSIAFFVTLALVIGCGASTKVSYDNEYDADVIIVGAGGGGLSSALEAVKLGAEKVIILEKLTMTGGSLNTTGGTISGAETIIQQLDGLTEDTLESYKQDIISEGSKLGGKANEALVDSYVKEAKEAVNWLWENGLKDYEFAVDDEGRKSVFAPEHTLYSYPRSYKPRAKDQSKYKSAVHEILDQLIDAEDKIEIHYTTAGVSLLGNDKGQVLQVVGHNASKDENNLYTASKGVIMATGGYSANADLINHFNPNINGVITGGLSVSNGYGLYMMQEVGGAILEDTMGWVPTFPMGLESLDAPGTGRIMTTKTQFAGGILVNKDGKRFVNENDSDNVVREFELEKQPEGIQWEIYTDDIIEDLIVDRQGGMYKVFFMSDAGAPFINEANSLEELAKIIDVPEEALLETVSKYNENVETKTTDEFGREFTGEVTPFNVAVNKIEGEKYYAVKTKPLALLSMGGIGVDDNYKVVNEAGNSIPGLYAVGELVGGVWGRFVSSGVGVMGPIVQGKLAVRDLMNNELTEGDEIKVASNIIDKKFFEAKAVDKKPDVDVNAKYKDGEYEATVDGQNGPMTVKVIVKDEVIDEVVIVSHDETESIAAETLEKIPAQISEKKSLEGVDALSGATLTYDRIIKAVTEALKSAQ